MLQLQRISAPSTHNARAAAAPSSLLACRAGNKIAVPAPMRAAARSSCTPSSHFSSAMSPRMKSSLSRLPRAPHRAAVAVAASSPLAAVPAAAPGKTTLGFVGIGIMGLPMTLNLLKAGYDVVVWNRSADKCAPLAAAGARVAASARDVAAEAVITFGMLSDPPAALAVAEAIAAGIGPGKGYVDVSTVDAATSQQIAAAVHAAGAAFLEAPVSGSKGPAEQGALIFLTAGDEQLYNAAAAPLDVMGKANFYLGHVGAGANMKLVVNMVMGSMMAAFAEGLSLANKVGLKEQDVVDVVALGAIAAPMFALKAPPMLRRAYAPAFPLKHQQKDLRLALALGDAAEQPLPVAAAANELFIQARAQGLGDADFSAVLQAVLGQQQ